MTLDHAYRRGSDAWTRCSAADATRFRARGYQVRLWAEVESQARAMARREMTPTVPVAERARVRFLARSNSITRQLTSGVTR